MVDIRATSMYSSPEKDDDQYNNSLEIDQMTEILRGFYDDFNNETNYLLIILYVPVIVLAVAANILVIVVVFKYHYMRRYFTQLNIIMI